MTATHRAKATGRIHNSLNHLCIAVLLGEMVDGPFTVNSLMAESGLSRTTIYRVVRAIHLQGVVHVSGWEKDAAGRVTLPVYTLGRGKDVKRSLKSKKQINRDYEERQRLRMVAEGINARLATALTTASNDSRRAA